MLILPLSVEINKGKISLNPSYTGKYILKKKDDCVGVKDLIICPSMMRKVMCGIKNVYALKKGNVFQFVRVETLESKKVQTCTYRIEFLPRNYVFDLVQDTPLSKRSLLTYPPSDWAEEIRGLMDDVLVESIKIQQIREWLKDNPTVIFYKTVSD